MILIHYQCPKCWQDFWLKHELPTIQCTNVNCSHKWEPSKTDNFFEKGIKEDHQIQEAQE